MLFPAMRCTVIEPLAPLPGRLRPGPPELHKMMTPCPRPDPAPPPEHPPIRVGSAPPIPEPPFHQATESTIARYH